MASLGNPAFAPALPARGAVWCLRGPGTRAAAGSWRVEDLIRGAEIGLGCCSAAIPLDALDRDLLPGVDEMEDDAPRS